jgi:asparagine synthase (glutamine-hydrolysing)
MADDILTKVDRATMHVSLEGREPMLDHRIVEFAARLPSSLKYRNGTQKYLLRKLTHTYLPEKIMNRPKMGFGVPIYAWFQKELKSYFLHYLDGARLEKQGIFNTDEVIRLRDDYLDGQNENVEKLWSILVFQMWHERWMEEARP